MRAYNSFHRKFEVDHHFFSREQNETTLYWAGFLASSASVSYKTSGQISYRLEVTVSDKHQEHIQKLANTLKTNAQVKPRPLQRAVKLLINSKDLVLDLQKYNLVPKKKHQYLMPDWLVQHQDVRHFLRGWTDGIGGIYVDSSWGFRKRFKTYGTKEFLEQFKNLVVELGIKEEDIKITGKVNYKLTITDIYSIDIVSNWLYGNSNVAIESKKKLALIKYIR